MRVKELWSLVPVPKTVIKHLYTSLTLSRYTIFFTVSLLIYTLTLSSLHISSYVTTHNADLGLSKLMEAASVRTNLIPVITTNQQGQDVLQLCDGIPNGASDERCSTVFVPSATSTDTAVPNNAQQAPSTVTRSSQATQSLATPEAANVPSTTAIVSTSSVAAQDNLLAATPTSASSTSIPVANATTSLDLGIADVELPTSSSSTTVVATDSLKSNDNASTSTTAVASSGDITSTGIPTATQDSSSTVDNRETSSVETTTTTSADAITSVPPLITSVPPLSTSSEDRTTSEVSTTSTTSTTSREDQTTSTTSREASTTLESTSTTEARTTTSTTSVDSVTTTKASTTTESSSTSTAESSSTTSTSAADISIAFDESSTTASVPTSSSSDAILSLQTAPLSATSAPSITLTSSSALPENTTSLNRPDIGTGPEEPENDSPSLQPLPNANISSIDSPSNQTGSDVPTRRAVLHRRSLSATPVTNSSGQITGLNVTGLQSDGSPTFIDLGCAGALALVEEQMHESWTEDLIMVGYHIWLLLLGGFAIASESIPHTLASLFSTIVALVWSASQLSESRTFRSQFTQFITDGACDGVDLLPTYWADRMKVDIAIFTLDALAVVGFGFMGTRLVKDYRKRMSIVVGQGEERRVYKTVLLLSVVIQLGAFLQLASLSLWVQQLFTSPIAQASSSTNIFKPLSLLSILITIPWLVLGLFAIRRESKPLMLLFIIIDIAFIGEWVVFFSSDIYRLVFTKWTFFAAGTVGTFAVLVGCLMSGVLAWMQFGRGLSEKLAQSTLDPVDTTPWEFSSTSEKAWEPFGTEKSVARSHALGGSIGGGNPTHQPSSSFERTLDPFSSNPGFGTGGLGIGNMAGLGYGVGYTGNYGSLGFGKQTGGDNRHGSNLTSLTGSTERGSTAFSYGLRSPAPPIPGKKDEYLSRFSN